MPSYRVGKTRLKIADISQRAAAYDIPGVTVDGNDLIAVYEAASVAVDRARTGGGPTLIEAKTYRWKGHSKSDRQRYRTKEEVTDWQAKDPIQRLVKQMKAQQWLDDDELAQLDAQTEQTIADAIEFAKCSPDPDPAAILEGVYA